MSILNVDKIQPIGGGSTITVDATDIQASTGTITASTFSGDVSATGIGVTSLSVAGVTTFTGHIDASGDVYISDKIIHAGDTDTKIRFPAANTVTVETAGSERLRIASDGNMGLGTNSLVGNAANVYLTVNGSTLGGIALKANGTNQGYLQGTSSLIRLSSDGSKPITFDTNGSERLRITSSGNIGAGTNNPDGFYTHAKNLVIGSGSSGEGITIFSGTSDSGYIGFNDTASNSMQGYIQYNHNGDYMAFGPNGTEKVRIDSSGRLFVNRTAQHASSSERLSVNGMTSIH